MEMNPKANNVRMLIRKIEELQLLATSIGIDAGVIQDVVGGKIVVEPSFIVNLIEGRLKVDIIQKTRLRDVVDARRILCYLLRKYSKLSLKNIGPYVNLADHSGVIHHIRVLEGFLENNDRIRELVSEFENSIISHYEKTKNEYNNI